MADVLDFDVVIIGGGPAGLACGQYSARAGRKTAIVEEMACGGQTMIIDEIENYPGLPKISGYEIGVKFEEQATAFGCTVIYSSVSAVNKKDSVFEIVTSDGVLTAKAVVAATGAKHRELGVPGEQELKGHGVSYCATCDGPFFKNKKILVCGGGDSAVQESVYLAKLTDKLTICHRRDKFRAQQAVIDKLKECNVSYKMSHKVLSVNGENNRVCSVTFFDSVNNREYTEDFDAVFVFVGVVPQTALFPMCKQDESGFIITDNKMHTSVEGIFAAGDVRDTPFRQIVTATADGAVAAHYASEYIDELAL